jgi:hypothetical protein
VRDLVGVAEAVQGARLRGRGQLIRPGPAGVRAHPVEGMDEPFGAAAVPQFGGAEGGL